MRRTHKLILITVMALIALASFAGTAHAQEEPVEVYNEALGFHCDQHLAACEHHIQGFSILTVHQFGSEVQISACQDEFVASILENGSGHIETYNNNASSVACTRIKCNGVGESAGETEWPISNTGEYTGTQTEEGHTTVRFCLDNEAAPNDTGFHCNVELDIANHGNHHYGFTASNEECPFLGMQIWLEVDGNWESEASPDAGEDDIEFVH